MRVPNPAACSEPRDYALSCVPGLRVAGSLRRCVALIASRTNDRQTMTPREIEACWNDPRNRKGGVYFCKADPRVIVPRHRKWMGWTINFARPTAFPVLLGMIALLVLPANIVRVSGGGTIASSITGIASIAVVCLLSAYLSSTKRWSTDA